MTQFGVYNAVIQPIRRHRWGLVTWVLRTRHDCVSVYV